MDNNPKYSCPVVSDAEIFSVACDIDSLLSAPDQSYWQAWQQFYAKAQAWYREDRQGTSVGDHIYAGRLARMVSNVTGASCERCQAIAEEILVGEYRWTLREELRRLADLARRGIPLYSPADSIADEAGQRHAEEDRRALEQSAADFEVMCPTEDAPEDSRAQSPEPPATPPTYSATLPTEWTHVTPPPPYVIGGGVMC